MAIYYVYSGAGGSNNGSSWANAFTTLTTAFATEVAGDTLYVAHDHAESTASSITLTSSGSLSVATKIVCVNRAGTVPPISADRRATAQVTTTAAGNITLSGCAHYDGIIFNAAGFMVIVATSSNWHRFDNCSLRIAATQITVGATTVGGSYVELNNTTLSFSATSQFLQTYGRFKWRNTPSALLGTIPTTLFASTNARGGSVECIGVDLSAAGAGKTLVDNTSPSQSGSFTFIDCKLHASVTKAGLPSWFGAADVDFVRSGASGANYYVYRARTGGTLIEETTIVRTGGASDGTTPLAWKIVTATNCHYSVPFECPPIAIWNDTTGSAVTATVECIGAAIATDQEVWLEVEYLGDASSPQGSFVNDGKADLLATAANQTSSSEAWGGSTAAFKLACTFTPQQKGWLYCRIKIGKASSTFYIDPLVTLT